jgi:hypothetical protein
MRTVLVDAGPLIAFFNDGDEQVQVKAKSTNPAFGRADVMIPLSLPKAAWIVLLFELELAQGDGPGLAVSLSCATFRTRGCRPQRLE